MEEDDTVAAWSERVRSATAEGRPLRIRGGGTKDWYGQTLEGDILDTRAHRGIVAYDPAELVITARAGTPLLEIEAALAAHDQMLAFEPPHFGLGATFGGCIAAGIAGPRRPAAGAARDFVLGAVIMNGQGQVLHFGGQVVKNVAGYDVSRLIAGSLGTLGLILELSVKVLPLPKAEATLKFDMNGTDAVRKLNEWGGRPLPITASAWRNGTLALRLGGAEAAVKSARTSLGGEVVDAVEAERFWAGLREQTDPFFGARTVTGEHGVGIEKINSMCVQFSPEERDAFHAVKRAFDPPGLLNPDKGIPTRARCAEYGRMHVRGGLLPHPELPRF